MYISSLGIELIKHYEGIHDGDLKKIGLQPKMCPAGIWTVGYGRALKDENGKWLIGEAGKGKAYTMYPNLTEEQAEIMLNEDCKIYGDRLNSMDLCLSQHEFDALVSFTYNVGFSNFKKSTLLQYILTHNTYDNIKYAFRMWNKARVKGKLIALPGLTLRRESEANMYINGTLNFKP
jgi:lysozyme